jgi:hypothetical protein
MMCHDRVTRRALVLALPIIACSGPAKPVPTPPAPSGVATLVDPIATPPDDPADQPPPLDPDVVVAIDWASASTATDADANALWRRILPDARSWELRVVQIPDEHLVPLAAALLRGGNFACAPLSEACAPGFLGFADPTPEATFDDPCLRRALALWALPRIDTPNLGPLVPTLKAMLATPSIDEEVAAAALVVTGELPETTRMELLRAARGAGHASVDTELGELSEASLTTAAMELHIDGAVEALDAELSRPVFVHAIADPQLRPRTRIAAIQDLAASVEKTLPRDLEKALVVAAKDPDCALAATAGITLASFGKKGFAPKRPKGKKAGDALRALCVMAAGDAVEAAADFIGPAGLKVVERTFDPTLEALEDDENLDGDRDPRTSRTVETIAKKDLVDIPFATDLPTALAHCKGTVCSLPGAGIELSLAFVPAKDGGLWLDAIERRDRGDCGE